MNILPKRELKTDKVFWVEIAKDYLGVSSKQPRAKNGVIKS